MGKYIDEVLYDLVPLQVGHVLLGCSWQYDRRVVHDGFTNKYSFIMNGKNIVLTPLSPKELYKDKKIMRERIYVCERKRNNYIFSNSNFPTIIQPL